MARLPSDLPSSEITPQGLYLRRRDFLALGAAGAGALLLPRGARGQAATKPGKLAPLANVKESPLSTRDEKLTPYQDITTYNNFYEFGTSKQIARNALAMYLKLGQEFGLHLQEP